ncbi:MAG: hypothetical protein IPK17_23340 [Chloroflexi bacterium]|uniref:hypothetical protein n=1 Tax=Candidatus Flexifilum breve TaxID=3140694 RepID=UPI00313649BC|nr:hypothetical protein [Chloroflexota bacterium]
MVKKSLLLLVLLGLLSVLPVSAGERVISVNSGDGNASWFISGEPSLVMNGFDLQSLGIARPAVIDRISISVNTPVASTPVDVVVYQDANGGSPIDATLAGTTQATITTSGVFTVVLPTPITVNQPVIWIGFYLPVDFSFYADTSGTSVLTYWAWTPGGRFDLNNLASASVLGPADGTAPVNINMNGKARITAEITGAGGSTTGTAGTTPQGTAVNTASMSAYPTCGNALWDTADEIISNRDEINLHCQEVPAWQAPSSPLGYVRRGPLYDIQIYRPNGNLVSGRMDIRVTHCIRPAAEDLSTAVVGNAWGAPRTWSILPSVIYGDLVCAEVRHGGNLSYFVPSVVSGT